MWRLTPELSRDAQRPSGVLHVSTTSEAAKRSRLERIVRGQAAHLKRLAATHLHSHGTSQHLDERAGRSEYIESQSLRSHPNWRRWLGLGRERNCRMMAPKQPLVWFRLQYCLGRCRWPYEDGTEMKSGTQRLVLYTDRKTIGLPSNT